MYLFDLKRKKEDNVKKYSFFPILFHFVFYLFISIISAAKNLFLSVWFYTYTFVCLYLLKEKKKKRKVNVLIKNSIFKLWLFFFTTTERLQNK